MDNDDDWVEWLEWFHDRADFGPADGDVREIMMEEYEAETGNTCPTREEEDDG